MAHSVNAAGDHSPPRPCAFCAKSESTPEAASRHTASHLVRIALFALPRSTGIEIESTDENRNGSAASNCMAGSVGTRSVGTARSRSLSFDENPWLIGVSDAGAESSRQSDVMHEEPTRVYADDDMNETTTPSRISKEELHNTGEDAVRGHSSKTPLGSDVESSLDGRELGNAFALRQHLRYLESSVALIETELFSVKLVSREQKVTYLTSWLDWYETAISYFRLLWGRFMQLQEGLGGDFRTQTSWYVEQKLTLQESHQVFVGLQKRLLNLKIVELTRRFLEEGTHSFTPDKRFSLLMDKLGRCVVNEKNIRLSDTTLHLAMDVWRAFDRLKDLDMARAANAYYNPVAGDKTGHKLTEADIRREKAVQQFKAETQPSLTHPDYAGSANDYNFRGQLHEVQTIHSEDPTREEIESKSVRKNNTIVSEQNKFEDNEGDFENYGLSEDELHQVIRFRDDEFGLAFEYPWYSAKSRLVSELGFSTILRLNIFMPPRNSCEVTTYKGPSVCVNSLHPQSTHHLIRRLYRNALCPEYLVPEIEQDHYELLGPDGPIAPEDWEETVQPGWTIRLCFSEDFLASVTLQATGSESDRKETSAPEPAVSDNLDSSQPESSNLEVPITVRRYAVPRRTYPRADSSIMPASLSTSGVNPSELESVSTRSKGRHAEVEMKEPGSSAIVGGEESIREGGLANLEHGQSTGDIEPDKYLTAVYSNLPVAIPAGVERTGRDSETTTQPSHGRPKFFRCCNCGHRPNIYRWGEACFLCRHFMCPACKAWED